jgi:uncharacterized protein YecT (DUF1311 family)
MKAKTIPIVLALLATASLQAKENTCSNLDNADQSELSACAGKGFKDDDAELNRVYQQVLANFAKDRVFIGKLKAAQRAWITFRDAQLEALYPEADKSAYGSAYPMCYMNEKASLTRERTKQLRAWLDDQAEGDVCVGSIPVH